MPKMRKTDADAIDQTQFTIDEDLREIKWNLNQISRI
jgi:hypothetical protein